MIWSMKTVLNIGFLLGLVLMVSCETAFDYSPYCIDFSGKDKDVNLKNIDRIIDHPANDTIQIAFTGDTHNFFDELGFFVEKVNTMDAVNFVIHVGDIADFGLPKQYLWGNSFLSQLKVPYLVTIGNHDLVGNGMEAYMEMYGPLNFSFIYQSYKFIFLNTNSLEFQYNGLVPDLLWLEQQLLPSNEFNGVVLVFHLPPGMGFDPSLEAGFYQTISKFNNVIVALHGHLHGFEMYYPTTDSIPYVDVYGVEYSMMTTIKIFNRQIYVDEIPF